VTVSLSHGVLIKDEFFEEEKFDKESGELDGIR
jgi:hypothetical protein